MSKVRNEVFNSKKLNLNVKSLNANAFTVKPIRGEDGNYQLCVTFDKSSANAISFFVGHRLKGTTDWRNTPVERQLNVINVKNVEPGVYEVRVVVNTSNQQMASEAKEVTLTDERRVAPVKSTGRTVSETVLNIAHNLADDIIAEVYFNLSNADSVDTSDHDLSFYDQKDMT